MKLLIRSINTPRPPRVWSTDGDVHVSLDTDGTGLVMTPGEARALADKLRAAAGKPDVPSDWVMVSRVPTHQMILAAIAKVPNRGQGSVLYYSEVQEIVAAALAAEESGTDQREVA